MLHFIWTIIIGFVAGLIARAVTPGDKGPNGFVLTSILGIVGALAATYLGQASECRLYRSYRRRSAHTIGLGIFCFSSASLIMPEVRVMAFFEAAFLCAVALVMITAIQMRS